MANSKNSEASAGPVSDQLNENSRLSLDWWAVIFAFTLVTLVLAGLQVTW